MTGVQVPFRNPVLLLQRGCTSAVLQSMHVPISTSWWLGGREWTCL